MRDQCHLLMLGVALLIVVSALSLTLLQPLGVFARQAEETTCTLLADDSYHSPQCCSHCHPDKYHAWSLTSHASARVDPLFLVGLDQESDPGECYRCHTTGYDAASRRYALAGVTCEECHAPFQPGHTSDTMAVQDPLELCGTCHTRTLDDWQAGLHGEPDQTCNCCHSPHS